MRQPLRIATLLLATLLARTAVADPIGPHFYVVPVGGFTVFDGGYRFPDSAPLTDHFYVGARGGYHMKSWLGFEVGAGYTPTSEALSGGSGQDVKFLQGSADIVLSHYTGRYGGPFLLIGAGASKLETSGGAPDTSVNQGNLELGAGVQFWMSDKLALRVEARDLNWVGKGHYTDPFTHTVIFGAGLTYAIGAQARDTDMDGVPDSKDQCPDTPHGAVVDASGCPHDADGDGVLDGLDRCPDTPKGATIDAQGCPHDQDGDGVFDGLDKCADTPKGATVDSSGCPHDSDGDGVLDGLDKCPDTPAGLQVDSTGCSVEYSKMETEMLDTGMIRLQNLNFETGKSTLLPESYPALDAVGALLTKWPELKIEIGGHTDSKGKKQANVKLSKARVDAVLAYLVQKYPSLKPEQFVTKGYGSSKPLVPETSDASRAKNRRVEFKVLNTDVLRHAVESKKPAQPEKK